MIVQQNSDDEKDDVLDPNSVAAQTNSLVDILLTKISDLENVLTTGHTGKTTVGSVSSQEFMPLGQQRLRSTELVLNMIKLNKDTLWRALGNSNIFKNLLDLVKEYPWNNFFQLKVINICTEIIQNNTNPEFRT